MKSVTLDQVKQAGMVLKRVNEEKLRLEKVAEDLQLEKRAMKIAFREVELGLTAPFHSFEELLTKVAGLMKEDLDVVEKALERGYGSLGNVGTLADEVKNTRNMLERWVLEGEL
jgi:hypothetical protein